MISELTTSLREFYPPHPDAKSAIKSVTTGSLRSDHDYKRQSNFLEKAEASGHIVIRGDFDAEKRRMGISLVIMKGGVKGSEGGLMEEEIFGPVLPIIPVDVSYAGLLPASADDLVSGRCYRFHQCSTSSTCVVRMYK